MVKAQLTHRTWGDWPSIVLATEAVELEVVSEVGARVVSLRDKRRDREWLVQGHKPRELEQMDWAEQSVVFAGRESFGWDECLPTTAPCGDPLAPGTDLRDHGDQWGRGAYLHLDHDAGAVQHTWAAARWAAIRLMGMRSSATRLPMIDSVSRPEARPPMRKAGSTIGQLRSGLQECSNGLR